VRVRASLKVVFTGEVGALGLGGCSETEGGSSGLESSGVLGLITLLLLRDMLLLRDQVVDTFFKLHVVLRELNYFYVNNRIIAFR
jgi:hypothetical protein